MAAKEEALVLKYLKKNPGSEALDVSFGTDVDESVVKEVLEALLSKQQVSKTVSDSGVATWVLASGPAPKVQAPKESSSAPLRSEDIPSSSDDSSGSTGTGKGFVIIVALLTAIVAIAASYFMASSAISAERAKFDLQLKNATDSVGFYKITTNQKLDALEQEIKKLQPPPVEEKAAPAPKKAAKTKKRR